MRLLVDKTLLLWSKNMPKNFVITGASSEIGLAICNKVLQSNDYAILQCFKHTERCTTIQQRLGNRCQVVPVDFRNLVETDNFCKKLGEVDIFINTAAVTTTDLLAHLTDEEIMVMLDVNILALIKLSQAVIPSMLLKRNGIIINISSVAAQRGSRGQTGYAGTKGFMEAFTRSLASEYGSRNIRANCVAPGPIDAGSLKSLLGYAEDEVKNSVTLPRLGNASDVAATVAFLCREEASFINGACIPVNGGFCRGV
jgi:3-oxoacyl-[acyl-carrier protein] reductase